MTLTMSFQLGRDMVPGVLRRMQNEAAPIVARALDDVGAFHKRRMVQGQFTSYRGKSPSGKLQRRSGLLANSIGWQVVRGSGLQGMALFLTADTKYARIQERGGTIRPRRARALTVPMRRILTPAGNLKGAFRIVRDGNGFRLAGGQRTFIFTSKRGKKYIGAQGIFTRGRRPAALYALKDSVTIEPSFGFVDTYRERTSKFMAGRLRRAARDLARRAKG